MVITITSSQYIYYQIPELMSRYQTNTTVVLSSGKRIKKKKDPKIKWIINKIDILHRSKMNYENYSIIPRNKKTKELRKDLDKYSNKVISTTELWGYYGDKIYEEIHLVTYQNIDIVNLLNILTCFKILTCFIILSELYKNINYDSRDKLGNYERIYQENLVMLFQIYIVMKDQIKNDYLKKFYIRIYTGSFKRKDVREWILFKFETPTIFNFLEDFKSFRKKKSKTFSLSFSHPSTTNNVYIKENSHNYPGDTPIYRFIMALPRRLPITHPTTPDSSNANTQVSTSYEHE